MRTPVERRTVNLSAYPDLVVIYLGCELIASPEARPCSALDRRFLLLGGAEL